MKFSEYFYGVYAIFYTSPQRKTNWIVRIWFRCSQVWISNYFISEVGKFFPFSFGIAFMGLSWLLASRHIEKPTLFCLTPIYGLQYSVCILPQSINYCSIVIFIFIIICSYSRPVNSHFSLLVLSIFSNYYLSSFLTSYFCYVFTCLS